MMDSPEGYCFSLTKKLLGQLGKPNATIVVVAFLLIWTALALVIDIPMTVYLIANMAVSGLTLLTVLLVQNAHKQDIRALQAKIEELAIERQHNIHALADTLTETELQQVRDLLQRSDGEDLKRRPDRDKRPSLF